MTPGGTSPAVRDEAPSALAPQATQIDWKFRIFMAIVAVASSLAVLVFITNAGATSRFNDFYVEAWPAYSALAKGHVLQFFQLGPAYLGSLVLRAPIALIPTIWGGGPKAVFFAAALPCMLVLAGFCVWLSEQPRRRGGISPAAGSAL